MEGRAGQQRIKHTIARTGQTEHLFSVVFPVQGYSYRLVWPGGLHQLLKDINVRRAMCGKVGGMEFSCDSCSPHPRGCL